MDRWVSTPPRVTSPTWGPSPPCKQALSIDCTLKYFQIFEIENNDYEKDRG